MLTAMKLYLGRDCSGGTGDSSWVRLSVEDDIRSGRPSSSRNKDNVVRIRDMPREDRTATVRRLADALHINKSTCHQILREDLGKRKLNTRLVPHHSLRIKRRCELQFVLICYTRRRTMPLLSTVSLPRLNHGVSCTTLKPRGKAPIGGKRVLHRQRSEAAAIDNKGDDNVFFDARGIVHHEFVPQEQRVNQEVYISVLRRLREALRRRRPDPWASRQCVMHGPRMEVNGRFKIKKSNKP